MSKYHIRKPRATGGLGTIVLANKAVYFGNESDGGGRIYDDHVDGNQAGYIFANFISVVSQPSVISGLTRSNRPRRGPRAR